MSEPTSSSRPDEETLVMDDFAPKFDMPKWRSSLDESAVSLLSLEFGIPESLNPRPVPEGMTMNALPDDAIGWYLDDFYEGGISVPFSIFLLEVITYFKVHISQLVPLGLHRVSLFEVYCHSLDILPSVPLFRVFYKLSKAGDWFSFEKRVGRNRKVCFHEILTGLKGWKTKFFFIDRRAIPFAMPWRHRDSDISDSFPNDGYKLEDVEKLSANVIDLLEIPRDFLYILGLTSHWDHPGFRALLVDAEGKGITLSFLTISFFDPFYFLP